MRPSTIDDAQARPVALALGAGGIKGWAHIGVLQVLREAGIPIDFIAGASAGALIGPLYAARADIHEAERIALGFSLADYTDWFLRGLKIEPSGGRIARQLWDAYGRLHFEQLAVPFAVVAHDVATGRRVVLNEGPVGPAVEASIRPPFFGRPVSADGHALIDGGFQLPVPSDVVRDMGAGLVIAVNLGVFVRLPRPLGPQAARFARAANRDSSDAAGLRSQFIFMCRLLSRQRLAPPFADVEIRPNMRGISAFAPWQAKDAVRRGEIAARRALPQIRRPLSLSASASPR